jgi:hypothetical protein
MKDAGDMDDASASLSMTSLRSKQERLQQLRQEKLLLRRQMEVQQFASNYEIEVAWPALIRGNRRTDPDLIQHRLLEAGMLYEIPETLRRLTDTASKFVSDLEQSQCFKAVRVEIGGTIREKNKETGDEPNDGSQGGSAAANSNNKLRHLTVHLQEANWYRLHVGGGVKGSSLLREQNQQPSAMTAELECSLGLRNLTGHLDTTDLQYTIDSQSIASLKLHHRRPLYASLPSPLREYVLSQPTGSQMMLDALAGIDTADHTWTRSYREFQRLLSVRAYTPQQRWCLEWSVLGRDLVPQRHSSAVAAAAAASAYGFAASNEIVAAAGPTVRHAFTLEYKPPPVQSTDPSPSGGEIQFHGKMQVATPPGDVGYVKLEGGFETTQSPFPLGSSSPPMNSPSPPSRAVELEIHTSFRAGYLHHLDFGGLTRSRCLSDRFFVGGPMQLRGFGPCGIGPRAAARTTGGPGDALGGDFYYTGTILASVPPLGLLSMLNNSAGTAPSNEEAETAAVLRDSVALSLRLFGFVNFGTCVGHVATTPLASVLRSTRASVGVGLSTSALGPVRVELTYAIPLRYGPRDVRRAFQFGMGLNV